MSEASHFSSVLIRSAARRAVAHRPNVEFAGAALALCGIVAFAAVAVWPSSLAIARSLPPLTFLLGTMAAWGALAISYPHGRVGLCNLVTLARAALVSLLAAPLASPGGLDTATLGWITFVIGIGALALDGVDGWLARRDGLVSDFGARFDIEVDSAFALVLATLVWLSGLAGAWVLALGTMRYAFVGATAVLPWLDRPLPASLRRKAICVLQLGALIVLVAPPVAPPVSSTIAAVATAALVWSFAVDIAWLWQKRRET